MTLPHRPPHKLLTIVLSTGALMVAAAVATAAPNADSTRRELAQARSSAQGLRGQIAATSAQIESLQAPIAEIDTRLVELQRKLTQRKRRLASLERKLDEQAAQIERLKREFEVAQRQLVERMVNVYKTGDPSTLAAVVGTGSVTELLGRKETMQRVVDNDQDLIERVEELDRKVNESRTTTVALHAQARAETRKISKATDKVASTKAQLVQRQQVLAQVVSARGANLDSVEAREALLEENLAGLAAASPQLEQAIASAPAITSQVPAPAASGPDMPAAPAAAAVGGSTTSLAWPVGGSIVSSFGMRGGRMHNGIDIAAPSGTPIVASASGTVIYAGWMSGYGNLVVVQHADGLSTAYAHQSRIGSSNGQSVGRGQVIGYVGCTGSCFGDHVHFETRLNGSAVNPMTYL